MKIVVCCFYEAYPPITGAASVSYNLARFVPADTTLVQLGDRDVRFVTGEGLTVVTIAGASESRSARLARLPGFIRRMVAEILTAAPQFVILEGASWAFYHLMLMRGIRTAIPAAAVIYHAHNVEYVLRAQRHSRAIAILTWWAEGQLLRKADIATAVSAVDRDHFAQLYGVRPMLLPNGVDFGRFAHPDPEAVARMRKLYGLDQHTVLFEGSYGYRPNREAVDFLIKLVLPRLRERCPSATLALTGGGAPFREDWIRNPGVVPYDELATFVGACGVAVAPIFSGSGTRLKILEAMAAGVPVVATKKAAEGLPVVDGKDILLAQKEANFPECISRIFADNNLLRRLTQNAQKKVESEFSWAVIARTLVGTLPSTGVFASARSKRRQKYRPAHLMPDD